MPRSFCTTPARLPHYLRNSRRRWTECDEVQLATLACRNTPTLVIGLKLGRSAMAVRLKAHRLGLSLMPVNRSPDGTQR